MAKNVVHGSTSNATNNTGCSPDDLEDLFQSFQKDQTDLNPGDVEPKSCNRTHLLESSAQTDQTGFETYAPFPDREKLYKMVSSSSIA